MSIAANDFTNIRAALCAAMSANATFTGAAVAVVAETVGDIASRVARLNGQVKLVAVVPEPDLAASPDINVAAMEFEIHFYECVEVNRKGDSYTTSLDLYCAAFNLFFLPSANFLPAANWQQPTFEGALKEELPMKIGSSPVRIIHRALLGRTEMQIA